MNSPNPPLPAFRVRCAILGSSLHAAGLMHDLALRGWRDVLLLEPSTFNEPLVAEHPLLFHSGLKDCMHIAGIPLAGQCLTERLLLETRASDLTKPCKTVFPASRRDIAGAMRLALAATTFRFISRWSHSEYSGGVGTMPVRYREYLTNPSPFAAWSNDVVANDRLLADRTIHAAEALGAKSIAGWIPKVITRSDDGWEIAVLLPDGSTRIVSALYVANFMGPFSRALFESGSLKPTHHAIDGGYLSFGVQGPDLKESLAFRDETTSQPVTLVPWNKSTQVVARLIGAEQCFVNRPPEIGEAEAVLERMNGRFKRDRQFKMAGGVRWRHNWFAAASMAPRQSLMQHSVSRHPVIGEHRSARGLMITLYGGPPETYRSVASRIASRIVEHFGDPSLDRTRETQLSPT